MGAPRSKAVEEEGAGAQSSIFGGAKPVDTLKREKEMEERLQKEKEEKAKALEEAKKNKPSAASIFGSAKPVDTTQREREVEEKLSKLSTADVDANKSEDNQSRAYKPPARRDDRGYDRRDDRDRRDERGYERRDDRGGYDRRNDRGSTSSDRDRDIRSVEKDDRRRTPEPPVKKYEEPKPVNVVAQNKFAFLQEEDVDGGGSSEEN